MPGEKYSSYQIGGSAWRQIVMNRARRISDRVATFIDNEFDTDTASSEITSLTGTVTYDTGETGGVARLKTGVGIGSAGVYNAGGSALVASPIDESWYVHSRAWIRNAGSAGTDYLCIGLQDTHSGPAQYVALGEFSAHSTSLLTIVMNAGAGEVGFVTDVPADTTRMREYGIGRDAVADTLYVELDDTRIAELSGPFSALTSNPCFVFSAVAAPESTDVELWIDRLAAVLERS